MVKNILEYFRLYSTNTEIFWNFAQFLCLFLGIVSNPFVTAYQNNQTNSYKGKIIPLLVFSLIVAITIFPAVFKQIADNAEPQFIQLCVTFASGLGYQSLFMTGATLAKKVTGR
jgi:hypothetical protein